jgi:hypothetical protein
MSVALLLAAMANPAAAWSHTGTVWNRELMPLQWNIGSVVEDSLDEDYQETVLQESWDNWETYVPCAQLSNEYLGRLDNYNLTYNLSDQRVVLQYEDPEELVGTGTLGVTYCNGAGGVAFVVEGQTYFYNTDCDIVFNDDVNWGTTDDIENGLASSANSIEGVATHEIGHLWGMGHSCEQGDVCDDLDERYAVMYWAGSAGSTAQAYPTSDDIEGMNALYGPYASFSVTDEYEDNRFGGVPLEVCFEIESTDALSEIAWSFGDDATSSEQNPCHTYTEAGQYTVGLTVSGEAEACGTYSYTYRERAYILACEAPQPAEGFTGLFTYEHDDGTTYRMINQADTTVYGCIDQIQWDVFQGDTLVQSVSAWAPLIDFGAEGTYRVVLNVGGPGGVSAAELDIAVVDKPGASATACAAVGGAGGWVGALGALGLVLVRRRRRG